MLTGRLPTASIINAFTAEPQTVGARRADNALPKLLSAAGKTYSLK